MLRKPVTSQGKEGESRRELDDDEEEEEKEEDFVDWEDQILEDTVPLVGFVRMILHSGKYVGFTQFWIICDWKTLLIYAGWR